MAAFALSLAQSQAIVDMRLGRLTGLERDKLEAEFQALLAEIADLEDILGRDERVVAMILEDLDDLETKYGDDRRTEISAEEVDGSFDIEELITEEMMVVTFSRDGYVKRTGLDTYRAQARGGRGVKGSESKEGDAIRSLFIAGTHDYVLCFSNLGKVYWLKVYQLPEGGRTSKGRAIRNLLELATGEVIHSVLRVQSFDTESTVVFSLEEEDEVVSVALAQPGDTVLIGSAHGRAVRFDEKAARTMGRVSRGVRGMRLKPGDEVVSMIVLPNDADQTGVTLVTACLNGYGKRTVAADYPIKGRGNQGVINIKVTDRNGPVVALRSVVDGDDLMFISQSGMIVRTGVDEMRPMGRNTQGVRLVNLKSDDALVGIEAVSAEDLELEARNNSGEDEAGEPVGDATLDPSVAEAADEDMADEVDTDADTDED
jgi:DNA gyrase subunit A